MWTTRSPCCDWFYMQEKLPEVSKSKAGQHSGGEDAQQAGLLMRLPPLLVLKLCHVGIMFIRLDTRQDLAFALLFPGLFTFSLQRSLSLLQVPLAKSCGLSSTCSSGFCFKVAFADRIYSQTPWFPQQDNESAYCFTPALFPCYYIGFSIINYSSLPGWRSVHPTLNRKSLEVRRQHQILTLLMIFLIPMGNPLAMCHHGLEKAP